ncbi:MAG: SpoIIE family protein phosphatase, partial [Xanthomonadales bacterium]|nr:SpoIIE family protein phosphatase [Xanthomonadales bacterium]
GACLLLYSDGLNEAENEAGEQFGMDRVAAVMAAAADASAALAGINGELARYVGSAAAVDDLTLLLISRDRETAA